MHSNPNKHSRRSIRLRNFDYAQTGFYFVTICTEKRIFLFGEVTDGGMRLNDNGKIAEQCWLAIATHFPDVDLDTFVVMPNHVHGIITIREPAVGAKHFSPLHNDDVAPKLRSPSKTVGSIVRGFKIGVTKWFRENGRTDKIWQRNYYEHIIGNQESLNRIRQYIQENPLHWQFDRENPVATKPESQNAWLT